MESPLNKLIIAEQQRQTKGLELIPSENYATPTC
jgi:glycine/serine hydroxymethyltransferase